MPQAQDYNFMSGYDAGQSGSTLDSTPYAWNTPLPGPGSTVSGQSGSGVNWGGVAAGAAPVVASLFAGDRGSINPSIGQIMAGANAQTKTGQDLFKTGVSAAAPALDYFKSLLSGNPADVMAATAPDRRRVIDQYDTARRSAGQFTPRGGGQASTSQESRAREAGDLATLGSSERATAASQLAGLGLSEQQLGLSAEQQATNSIAQTLGPQMAQNQSDSQSTLQTIAGIAAIAALFI